MKEGMLTVKLLSLYPRSIWMLRTVKKVKTITTEGIKTPKAERKIKKRKTITTTTASGIKSIASFCDTLTKDAVTAGTPVI